ncbi:MAG: DUF4167 domain-containing protein [Paracoccaceae bacterium]
MRSSKSRSRSKNNRNRSVGNVTNRVFDSSGPEGKVRGTPQQIIEKYIQLTRDAQLSNDRVAAENFQQHSEHYSRMLSAAQREIDARREQQEREQRDRQQNRDEQRGDVRTDNRSDNRSENRPDRQPDPRAAQSQPQGAGGRIDPSQSEQPEILATGTGSGLVDTPEGASASRGAARVRKPGPAPQAKSQSKARPKPKAATPSDADAAPTKQSEPPDSSEAAE